jgi:hypothetical protein
MYIYLKLEYFDPVTSISGKFNIGVAYNIPIVTSQFKGTVQSLFSLLNATAARTHLSLSLSVVENNDFSFNNVGLAFNRGSSASIHIRIRNESSKLVNLA